MYLFQSPTGGVIRELVALAQDVDSVAGESRLRFWEPRRVLSRQCLHRGTELGQVRPDVAVDVVLDAIYGVLWLRLLLGDGDLDIQVADDALDAVWRGIGISPSVAVPASRRE